MKNNTSKGESGLRITSAICFIVFLVLVAACDNTKGMMHGSGRSMDMGDWNWILILIGIIIVSLLGYLVARRRR